LNVADPLVTGDYGKAAFDAVGPLLLIGWAEVGPDLLRALTAAGRLGEARSDGAKPVQAVLADEPTAIGHTAPESSGRKPSPVALRSTDRAALPLPASLTTICWIGREWRTRVTGTSIADRSPRTRFAGGSASVPPRSRLLVAIIRADSQQRSRQAEVSDLARPWPGVGRV
jgi:hypothetical protein